ATPSCAASTRVDGNATPTGRCPSRIAATIISRICAWRPTLLWNERWIRWFHIVRDRAPGIRDQKLEMNVAHAGPSLESPLAPCMRLCLALERHMMNQLAQMGGTLAPRQSSDPCPLIPDT